jgi:hypothetical protein
MVESVVDFSHARLHGSLDARIVAHIHTVDAQTIVMGDLIRHPDRILSTYGASHYPQVLA